MEDKLYIAGPCVIESKEHILEVANFLSEIGVRYIRGGCFKLRTHYSSFQGLGEQAVYFLKEAAKKYNLKTVSEITDYRYLKLMSENIDILQVGTRNMYNYTLLKDLGKISNPIILKRGFSASIEEWLASAAYIENNGNKNIILCERGIRTFNNYTRNTLDLSCIPYLKLIQNIKYKIIIDPSHGTGLRELVSPMSKAAITCGADGIIVEIHNNPEKALCDGEQAIRYNEFQKLYNFLRKDK
jgi:3-deoxy-7-phosphoheptulonate synthase